MMHHIDISSVLRETLACNLYSNLVTRPTGAAVRGQIEQLLSDARDGDVELTVIDFSHVAMIDFSCADEVIAKLLLRYAADDPPQEAYFVFRGVNDDHWDAIETVLERHGLALVIENDGRVQIVGVVTEDERRTWEMIYRLGHVDADDAAIMLSADLADTQTALDGLCRRRLVMNLDGRYVAVGSPRDR
jgi:hypothetical protein